MNVIFITLCIILFSYNSYGSDYKTFCTDGNDKSYGLNICVKYPQSYKSLDGVRPHVVHKFSLIDNNISISMIILIRNINKTLYSEIKNYSDSDLLDIGKEMYDGFGKINNVHITELEGEKVILSDGDVNIERLNKIIHGKAIVATLFYNSNMIQLQCTNSVLHNRDDIYNATHFALNQYWDRTGKNTCIRYINSLTIMDKYK